MPLEQVIIGMIATGAIGIISYLLHSFIQHFRDLIKELKDDVKANTRETQELKGGLSVLRDDMREHSENFIKAHAELQTLLRYVDAKGITTKRSDQR